jgi:DNA polymerase I-like protein with 3'-5' exonuclease and polymerase domains
MIIIDTLELEEKSASLSDAEIYWIYNALDCCVTYDVFLEIEPQLDAVSRATYNTSMATIPVFLEMMLTGFPVNLERRREVLTHYEKQLASLELAWTRLCSEGLGIPADRSKRDRGRTPLPVNPASPQDVQYLFHTVLQIPEKKKRKKGQSEAKTTTDREVLEGFRSYYFAEVFVSFILAMRDCNKAIGFLRTKLDADHRIRCSFNVAGTNTGRASSSFSDMGTGTNLQNISGKQKNIFVADEGWMLADIDLEQGDSRGVGAIAWNWFVDSHGEAWAGSYLDACESGDLHTSVAKMAWPTLQWTDDPKANRKIAEQIAYRDKSYRDLSKGLGHGTNYLGQPNTMAQHAHLPVTTIVDFQKGYFKGFPCIAEWQQETIRQVREERCLITPFGRRRYFWNDPNAVPTHNAAIAYAPQSTTGEFINRGAIQLQHFLNHNPTFPIKFLLQVHDSLVIMFKQREIQEVIPTLLEKLKVILPLQKGREFSIPLGVKVGWNYGATEFNKDGSVKDNHFGLRKWTGEEPRTPPKKLTTVQALLNSPMKSR